MVDSPLPGDVAPTPHGAARWLTRRLTWCAHAGHEAGTSVRRIGLIVGGGLTLRLALIALIWSRPPGDDAADYHQMAVELAQGAAFEPEWPPGLPYFLRPFQAMLGATALADRIAMLSVYLLFCGLLFGLARRAAGVRAAELALIALAVIPSFVHMSVTPLTQLPTAALLVGAAWAALSLVLSPPKRGRGWARAALLGLALAGLLLVRPSNLLVCAATPLILFVTLRRTAVLVAPALVVVLIAGGWTLRAHDLTGRWLFVNSANAQNLFYGNNPWTPLYRTWWFGSHKQGEPGVPDEYVATHARLAANPPAERDRAFSAYAVGHIEARPDLFAVRSLARVRTFFAFDTFTGAQLASTSRAPSTARKMLGLAVIAADAACYLVIAGLALLWFFQRPAEQRRLAWLLALGALLYAVPYFASFAHPTYHFPIVPLLAVAAAARLTSRPPPLSGRRRTVFFAAAGALALIQVEWTVHMFSRV